MYIWNFKFYVCLEVETTMFLTYLLYFEQKFVLKGWFCKNFFLMSRKMGRHSSKYFWRKLFRFVSYQEIPYMLFILSDIFSELIVFVVFVWFGCA